MSRKRFPALLKLLFGFTLAPTAVVTLVVAAETMGVAMHSSASIPFAGGIAAVVLLRLFSDFRSSWLGDALRACYVLGHELTHALAAWMSGESVHSFKVGAGGGHVEVSRSSTFIALAPYCVPVYSLFAIAGYRALIYWRPEYSRDWLFPLLMGLTLSFHLIYTFDCLWGRKQSDLAAAGGTVFSLAVIALFNGLVILVVLKALFPGTVSLGMEFKRVQNLSADFWKGAWVWAGVIRNRLRP